MIVVMLVDDDPLFDGAERNALIDAIRVEAEAADEIGELLVVGGGGEAFEDPLRWGLLSTEPTFTT